jgi:hypothetical protein
MSDFEAERIARHLQRSREAIPRDDRRRPEGPFQPAGRPTSRDAAMLLHLQRTAGNAGVVQMLADEAEAESPVHDVVGRGGGTALDDSTRGSMEASFGQSFADVRVHTDEKASRSAESVGANAYTVGSDIVFKSGQFNPASATGQRTIAHELTHVVQQRSGPVDGSDAPGGIRLSTPSDRFERAADATADEVVASRSVGGPSPSASSTDAAAAQRELDEAVAVQRTVQRQGEEPEPEEDDETATA